MGPFKAIATCYAKILSFSGRAGRAEFWWFMLFVMLAGTAIQFGAIAWALRDPALAAAFEDLAGIESWAKQQDNLWLMLIGGFVAYLLLVCLPQLSVTVRRLHDTNRRGWFILMPIAVAMVIGFFGGIGMAMMGSNGGALAILIVALPALASLWFVIVLCLPGTRGPNRFGPDPTKGRRRHTGIYPAFGGPLDPEERAEIEAKRRAEIRSYYRERVLPKARQA
jgi:uncharacterized membrane protein YhaH (DUF805 family)